MDVFFGYLREIGLLIAIIFSTILIIDITVRLGTGSVKKLAKLIALLDTHIKLIRGEVDEIRHDVNEYSAHPSKTKPKHSSKYYQDAE